MRANPLAFIDKVDLVHFNDLESIFWTKRNRTSRVVKRRWWQMLHAPCRSHQPSTHPQPLETQADMNKGQTALFVFMTWSKSFIQMAAMNRFTGELQRKSRPGKAFLTTHQNTFTRHTQKMGIWMTASCCFFYLLQLVLLKLLSPRRFEDVGRRVCSHSSLKASPSGGGTAAWKQTKLDLVWTKLPLLPVSHCWPETNHLWVLSFL